MAEPVKEEDRALLDGHAWPKAKGAADDSSQQALPQGKPGLAAKEAELRRRTYDSIDRKTKSGLLFNSDMSMDGPNVQQRKGCFLDRGKVILLACFFIGGLVLVGLLVGYLHKSTDCSDASAFKEEQKGSKYKKDGTTTDGSSTGDGKGSAGGKNEKEERPNVRLPSSLAPSSYDLELQVFMDTLTYNGRVSILIDCKEPTRNVTLHLVNLTVNDVSLSDSGSPVPIVGTSFNERLQFYIIEVDKPLTAGKEYNLTIVFNGTLHDNLDGFYWAKYKIGQRETYMATTQFEAVSARSAFPCFDEPAMKAVFNITLVHWQNMTAISNMPILKQESRDGDHWTMDHFQSTPLMSTYLLAFVISELKMMTTDNSDIKMSVWARPEIISSASYAGDIGPKILKHYETYFGIPYPLKKTDMVAAPDFNAGAMENWGLIIFRENSMLYDKDTTPASTKKKVAETVAHELAHQWFGNLVTPKWWDDLWLNEGFASYVEYLGTAFVEPTWEMENQFVVDYNQDVMDLDALKTSHPVHVPVYDPDEINEIFDLVSYEKGAAVIRMMDKFLGDEIFLKGLRAYLNDKKFANAETSELWTHLTAAQPENATDRIDVSEVMDKWTKQTGFPVVTITRHYGEKTVTASQKRFLLQKSNDSKDMDVLWDVPLTWADNTMPPSTWDTKVQRWLRTPEETFSTGNISDSSWIIFNNQETGFYRVNYDPENWKMLIDQLQNNHTKIHVINRAQILNDAFSLARVNEVNYTLALSATFYLAKEDDYIPWTAALTAMHLLHTMLSRSDYYGAWKKYVLKLVERQYQRLGWVENVVTESILTQFHRAEILQWACSYGHPECVANAKERFAAWKNGSQSVPPNLRSVVYCTGVGQGTEDDWNTVWERYQNETSPSERNTLLKALGCSREPWILSRLMRLALDPSKGIRLQDSVTALTLAANNFGREIYFNFVRDQYDTIYKRLGNLTFSLSYVVDRFADVLNTPFELAELKSFTESCQGKMGTAKRSFKQAIESVEANVQFMADNYKEICEWLEQNNVGGEIIAS